MSRRTWIAGAGSLALSGLARPLSAASMRPTIGVLGIPNTPSLRAVLSRMQELGWMDGRSATVVVRTGLMPALPSLAVELAQTRPDIVIATFDPAVRAAAQAIPTIPIVMASVLDPIGNGWVKSLREPGGRFTGTAWTQDAAMTGKYAELLAEAVPGMRRIGGMIDPTMPGIGIYRTAFEAAASRLGIEPIHATLSAIDALPEAMQVLQSSRVQAMFVYGSFVSGPHAETIAAAAASARIPACYHQRRTVELGGLMSYGPSIPDLSRRAVDIAARILRGESPARIPIEQPSRYETAVNLRAANAIGLRLPASFLARVDEVIE